MTSQPIKDQETSLSIPQFDECSAPAYHPCADGAHPAFIAMNESGEVYLGYGPQIGMDHGHGRTLCWDINPQLSGEEINALLCEITPLLEQVHAEHSIEWDGRNRVGELSGRAEDASEEIQAKCGHAHPNFEVSTAQDFLFTMFSIHDAWSRRTSLAELVTNTTEMAKGHTILIDDIKEAILREAKEEFDESEESLPKHILDSMVEEGVITAEELDTYHSELALA